MADILYKKEVCGIVGICMDVYNTPGYGFLEIVYKDAMKIEFIEKEMPHFGEKEFPIIYKGAQLKRTFFTDFSL